MVEATGRPAVIGHAPYTVAVGCLLAFAAISGVGPRRGLAAAVATRRIGSAASTVTKPASTIVMSLGLDGFGAKDWSGIPRSGGGWSAPASRLPASSSYRCTNPTAHPPLGIGRA